MANKKGATVTVSAGDVLAGFIEAAKAEHAVKIKERMPSLDRRAYIRSIGYAYGKIIGKQPSDDAAALYMGMTLLSDSAGATTTTTDGG